MRGRQSLIALAFALVAPGAWAPADRFARAAPEPSSRSSVGRVPVIYQNRRSFRIPFNIDDEGRAKLKEVQLWVSEDSGFHWEAKSRTAPDGGKFTFRTKRDGEYWFAVRTVTLDDKFSPPMDQIVEPSMKVVVDTIPPSLVLDPDGRRGSRASVRWEAKDEHLDLKSLVLEYQAEGVKEWRKVPIRNPKLLGAQGWDAGTADSLRVRASITDKAGNVADAEIVLPEGTASPADFAGDPEFSKPPPVEQISDRSSSMIAEGPGFPPVEDDPAPSSAAGSRAGSRRSLANRPRVNDNSGQFPAGSDWEVRDAGRSAAPAAGLAAAAAFGNPFEQGSSAASATGAAGALLAPSGETGGGPENRTMLVSSPRFKLQYAVEDAGPNGPAIVELWITRDGGRTWIRRGEDPDRTSPFEVDLGGEGTFGISLVSRSAAGLGDPPPAQGDPPQTWVEVDSSPPVVQLMPTHIGTGANAGKVAITWRASDLHLAPRPVSLLWKADLPGAGWQPIVDGLEAVGQYVWTVPPTLPPKFHLRVEAADTIGLRGAAETTDSGPVIVDRSRPRSRIIGLDPNARAGDGPSARPLR